MKILLIKPPTCEKLFTGDDFYMSEPLELEYVAAGVSDKHDVRILDMRLDPFLEKNLNEFKPDIVGLTSFTTQVYITKYLSKAIKIFNPTILVVVGGYHATLVPEDFCSPDIDIIVIGEGVFTFCGIVEKFEKNQNIYEVKGISFYKNRKLKFTEPRNYPNLDSFPFPNRSLTAHYRKNYFLDTLEGTYKPLATLRTSKGCPFRCKFCSCWKVTNGKYLARDPYAVMEEIKTIKEINIEFGDDESFIDIKRADKLADLIIESGIKKNFYAIARSDTVTKNQDLFQKWRTAGLGRILLGLESNRPQDLVYFRKSNTLDNNEKAISILKNMGFKIDCSFIVPTDYDLIDFDNLASYIKNLKVDVGIVHVLTPLPGTELYDELKDQLTTTDLELFDLTHAVLPTKLPLRRFYTEWNNLFFKANKENINKYLSKTDNPIIMQRLNMITQKMLNRHLHHKAVSF